MQTPFIHSVSLNSITKITTSIYLLTRGLQTYHTNRNDMSVVNCSVYISQNLAIY